MTHAIATDGLTKYYGTRRVVDGLSLHSPGRVRLWVPGRNGAGKSTTIKMLMGMVQPSYGRVELLGRDLNDLPPAERPDRLPGGRAAALRLDDRRRGLAVRPRVPPRPLERAHARTDPRPLRDPRGRRSDVSPTASGNVALALAIAPDPDLLVLDDPTLGLDTVARHDFLLSMIHLVQRRGRTILFSSHILADVERVADRIGVLVDGALRVDCPTDRFKEAVSKVVLEFAGRPPAFPGCAGLVQAWEVGRRLELVIVDFGDDRRRVVESLSPLSWDVAGLSLEDAFVAYTRGPRRSLPVFGEETVEGAGAANDRGAA